MLYDYKCTKCRRVTEVKMSMAEHEESKSFFNQKTACPHCNYVMEQQVAPLRFKLNGQGWFGEYDSCPDAYGITEMEMRRNLDMEKRIEGEATEMQEKDKIASTQG